MKIIISPAKKMEVSEEQIRPLSLPIFLERANILLKELKSLRFTELSKLLKASEAIVELNYERYKNFSIESLTSPALLSYKGLAFNYMGPDVFTDSEFDFLEKRLYIMSALFGLLRPFDAVSPYRLEMMAGLSFGPYKNLYDFWGDALYRELYKEGDRVLNLASVEYSKAISKYLRPGDDFIDVFFLEDVDGRLIQKASYSKMARGAMVRFIAENKIDSLNGLKDFSDFSYVYSEEESRKNSLVFIKKVG